MKLKKYMEGLFLIFLLLKSNLIYSQENGYQFSHTIEQNYPKENELENKAKLYSYIGEYQKALEVWDNKRNHIANYPIINNKFKAVSAIDYIENKAKTEQIIIINEAHYQPYHRVFTKMLLQKLYNQGFRYFSAETLTHFDTLRLNKSKFPILTSGYYTTEPCYGNLIREALKIGFKVFAYETNVLDTSENKIEKREQEQAKNIKKILDQDSNAKIFIHCGFGHLTEWCIIEPKLMGCLIREYTGINPYTIDQVCNTERYSRKSETPFYKSVNNIDYSLSTFYKSNNIIDYSIFIDSNDNVLNEKNLYDLAVFLPRTKYINGRPNWMFDNERKAYSVDSISDTYPCLIKAYIENEFNQKVNKGIPYDVIELKNNSIKKCLSLKNGNYILEIEDSKGIIKTKKIIINN